MKGSNYAVTQPTRVLICGTGGGGHALAGIISAREDVEVRVFTPNAKKAREWRNLMNDSRLEVTVCKGRDEQVTFKANSFKVYNDAQVAARGCDLILLTVPAFLHSAYLTLLAPYLEKGCVLVGLPGQNGFEFDVRKVFGQRLKNYVLMNFESLPWICRIADFGKSVRILGSKNNLVGAIYGDLTRARIADPLATMQRLLGEPPTLSVSGHLLGITLLSPNAYSHPPMMYGRWKDWDGKALQCPPLFYQGIDEETADLLAQISEEVVITSKLIMDQQPGLDLSQVIPMYEWDISCYGNDISDKTNLMTALRTNSGYEGITHPMIQIEGGNYIPDFNHRFLAEDVPFGLIVIRGIAEIAGAPTPCIDKVLLWCQQKMGKEYLVGSNLMGKDLATTRCPQRYGFRTISEVLGCDSKEASA